MAHPKTDLNERCKRLGLPKAVFRTVRSGPDHQPMFESEVQIGDEVYGRGTGKAKREAEREASKAALQRLDVAAAGQGAIEPSPHGDHEAIAEFDGPWPIFAEVLAAAIATADRRVDAKATGEVAIDEVRQLALKLYKETLTSLGEIVEVEEENG